MHGQVAITMLILKSPAQPSRVDFAGQGHLSEINSETRLGKFFAIWATFYLTNFHLNKPFPNIFFCRYFKVSNLVCAYLFDFQVKLWCRYFGIFRPLFPKIGRNFNKFSGNKGQEHKLMNPVVSGIRIQNLFLG